MEAQEVYRIINERLNIVDYAEYLGFHTKKEGNFYTLLEHDSVKIQADKNTYKRYSTGEYGDVIEFAKNMQQIPKSVAIEELKELCGLGKGTEKSVPFVVSKKPKVQNEQSSKPFELPERTKGAYKRLYAYLCGTRAIDSSVVTDLVQRNMLYEESAHNNAVFVGYDYDKQAKYAFAKSTNTMRKFAADIAGSKKYPVAIFIDNKSSSLIVTEAIIDSMSVMTIAKKNGAEFKKHSYLSMQGNNVESLKYHLENNPNITQVVMAVDNDKTGDRYRKAIIDLTEGMANRNFKVIDRRPINKDFNEDLQKGDYLHQKEDKKANEDNSKSSEYEQEC